MSDAPLHAHSLSEAYLYLMVRRCPVCAEGALSAGEGRRLENEGGTAHIQIEATCRSCGRRQSFTFAVSNDDGLVRGRGPSAFNTSDEPSRLIDLAQWLTLFRMIIEDATRETDKEASRAKSLEAAMCLEEALKFFDDPENDLPPDEAFFDEASRRRRRDHPEQFSRRRIVEMRAKLPTSPAVKAASRRRKPWWRPW